MRMRGHGVEEDDIGEGFGMRWCLRDTNRKYNNAGQLAIEIRKGVLFGGGDLLSTLGPFFSVSFLKSRAYV